MGKWRKDGIMSGGVVKDLGWESPSVDCWCSHSAFFHTSAEGRQSLLLGNFDEYAAIYFSKLIFILFWEGCTSVVNIQWSPKQSEHTIKAYNNTQRKICDKRWRTRQTFRQFVDFVRIMVSEVALKITSMGCVGSVGTEVWFKTQNTGRNFRESWRVDRWEQSAGGVFLKSSRASQRRTL